MGFLEENKHLTTVINVQNTLSLKTRVSDESEVGDDSFGVGADVLNFGIEDLQNLKFLKILDTSILNTVYIVLNRENFEKLGSYRLNVAIRNIGEINGFLAIPVIIDAQDYSTKTDKYDSIYDYYFIAKDEENVIASIQGFMYLLSKHQLIGMDWSDLRAALFYAGRVVLDNYTVPRGTSQNYNFSQNIKSNNPKKLIVSIMGSDGLMEASNIVENIKSKLKSKVNSVFVGTHYNKDITLDTTVISIYAPENE
ncbi:MAG: hypothetical protein ACRC0V_11735 [Fusobacteriaceae bacterium]